METIRILRKLFIRIAQDNQEYEKDAHVNEELIKELAEQKVDIYTFLERAWCCAVTKPPRNWTRADDNVGMLEVITFDAWWRAVGKKTRNMVRRAEKSGVKVSIVELTPKLTEGIWQIYNETPVRQDRAFPHYGESLKSVAHNMAMAKESTFIGAYLEDELVGFIQIIYGEQIAIISQILSFQRHLDKSINNALLAKAVEVCAVNDNRWLIYGRIGNHPSLDRFKESNGFKKYSIGRYYVPITWKGKLAISLGLHREFKDALPQQLKEQLFPIFNWLSKNKKLLKLKLSKNEEQERG